MEQNSKSTFAAKINRSRASRLDMACFWLISRAFALPVLAALFCVLLPAGTARAQDACQPDLVERQRYGFVAVSGNWAGTFAIGQLNAGWCVDFRPWETPPPGMDRALVLRTYPGYQLNPASLGPLIDDNPGAIWLVGNEPDCIWQDNVLPEEYARIYHDLYLLIKNRDRTSQVAVGGIVQPTPLRLEYLDRVLAAYQARYGHALPADLWHIHNAILNEERGGWGADIPPGSDAQQGVLRAIDDNDNMAIFQDQIWAFRHWMADRGYRGYPLVVTEFGILMPDDYGFDVTRVNQFMSNTFSFFSTAADPWLGDPADGGRLVQRWAWFSLDVPPWDPVTLEGFNGNLFDPETAAITAHGAHYAGLTAAFDPLAYVDLGLVAWDVPPAPEVVSPTQSITHTLQVKVGNGGTTAAGAFVVALDYAGPVGGGLQQAVAGLPPSSSLWLTFTLPGLSPGGYRLAVQVDAQAQITESTECNNDDTHLLVVPPAHGVYLPLVTRGHTGTPPGLIWDEMAGASGSDLRPAFASPLDRAAPLTSLAAAADPVLGFQEFPLPTAAAYPGQITLDPASGALWVTARDANKLARYDPLVGTWDEYDLPTLGSQPWGLDLDAAGNVWFAETAANQIGRLDVVSGTIAEYPIPTPDSQPWGVAVGGGLVWFTQQAGNKVARLDPATGAVVEYPLPTPAAGPAGIDLLGRYVWFAQPQVDRVGRLEIDSGQILDFSPPTPNSAPQDVALLPNGVPWFTERGGDKIFAIDPDTHGFFFEVPLPMPGSEPYGIALQGSEAVWFTERAAGKLGRFDGGWPPREYYLPTPESLPTDIVVDAAGCAWYTAPGANRIGRLCLRPPFYLPLVWKNNS
jgi:streptogramin lyase